MNGIKIDDDFKNLMPPLSPDEFKRLEESILKDGIRDKLIVWDEYLVDGHNRLNIAKKHNLKYEIERMDFVSKEDAINWMLNNQLGRRNVPVEKRVDIIFQADELIKSIYEEGRKKHIENAEKLNKKKKNQFSSTEENRKQPHNSIKQIADLAKTSESMVGRMKKIKKEDPEAYKEVVEGRKSVYTAYNDLPTVVNKHAEKEGFIKKRKRGSADIKKDETPSVVKKRMKKQSTPEVTEEEMKKQMFMANVSTLFMHLQEVEGFVGRTEDLSEVVKEAVKKDAVSMKVYKEALKKIIELMEVSEWKIF